MKVSDALLFIIAQQSLDGLPSYEIDKLLEQLHKFGCIDKGLKKIDGQQIPVWVLTEKGRRIVEKVGRG